MLRYRRRTKGHSRTVAFDSGAREIIERYRNPGNAHIFPIVFGQRHRTPSYQVYRKCGGMSRPHVRYEHKCMAAAGLGGKCFRYAVVRENVAQNVQQCSGIPLVLKAAGLSWPGRFEYVPVRSPRCFVNVMPGAQEKRIEVPIYSNIVCNFKSCTRCCLS